MNGLKWGIVGTNFVSDWFVSALLKSSAASVARVYSRSLDTGRAFASKYNILNVYDDFEAFLSGEGLDAVYIASPNSYHERHAIAALAKGKHALVEKPAAPDSDALENMLAAAKRSNVIMLEAMRPAFDPAIRLIEENMPRIAPVRRALISMNQYSSRYDRFKRGEILNAFNPKLANAALMDIGVYCVFVCARLFGIPRRVQADSMFLSNGMEGAGAAILSYEDMQAVINYSKINDSALPCEIQGERGTIRFDRINAPSRITITPRGGEEEAIEYKPVDNNMLYEIDEFSRLAYEPHAALEYTRVLRIQTRILDMVRANAGIEFA